VTKPAASIGGLKLPMLLHGIAISTGPDDCAPDQADADGEIRRQYAAAFSARCSLRLRR
jgi:hypothetical protein